MNRKLLFYPIVFLFIVTITLAFIPHHSCGCGDSGKTDGSLLKHHSEKIIENIINGVREIFN
jgi:hypothetical protein